MSAYNSKIARLPACAIVPPTDQENSATRARGPAALRGAAPSRAVAFATVDDQFSDIRRELAVQLIRMGQLQAQLDHVETVIKKLVVQV